MNNQEASANRKAAIFQVIGIIILLAGIAMAVWAFVDFFKAMSGESFERPRKFYLFFIGFPLIGIAGIFLNSAANIKRRREIKSYVKTFQSNQGQSHAVVNEPEEEDIFDQMAKKSQKK